MSALLTLDLGFDVARHDRRDELSATAPTGRTLDHESGATRPRSRTLDELVVGLWEGLVARSKVRCLVCGGPMVPRYGAGAVPVAGRCRDCGASLD